MLPNAFIGSTVQPSQKQLADTLGPALAVWEELIAALAAELAVTEQEWKSYSPKAGWSLRLKRKKRVIIYLSPSQGAFMVMFILGDKALAAARAGGLSQSMLRLLDEAPRYPEGTGVRIAVKSRRDLAAIKKLAKAKVEN